MTGLKAVDFKIEKTMYYYSLRIYTVNLIQVRQVNELLGVRSNYPNEDDWSLEVVQKEDDPPFLFIDYFLSLLEGKYEKLESIGISRENISIWVLYEYEGQCNMEYDPVSIKKMGENGIALCISCWEK